MPEQLDDEEWIAARAIGKLLHETGWRVWLAERYEHTLHVGVRKRAQHDGACLSLADELIERCFDGLRREDVTRLTADPVQQALKPALARRDGRSLDVAVGGDDDDREVRELLGQVLRQPQRRLVCPLHVVDEDDEGHEPTAARQEFPNIRKQVPLAQLRW